MLARTKKKLDLFLVETLETISENIKSAYEYIKIPKDDEDFEIKNDCKETLEILDEIRKNAGGVFHNFHNMRAMDILLFLMFLDFS